MKKIFKLFSVVSTLATPFTLISMVADTNNVKTVKQVRDSDFELFDVDSDFLKDIRSNITSYSKLDVDKLEPILKKLLISYKNYSRLIEKLNFPRVDDFKGIYAGGIRYDENITKLIISDRISEIPRNNVLDIIYYSSLNLYKLKQFLPNFLWNILFFRFSNQNILSQISKHIINDEELIKSLTFEFKKESNHQFSFKTKKFENKEYLPLLINLYLKNKKFYDAKIKLHFLEVGNVGKYELFLPEWFKTEMLKPFQKIDINNVEENTLDKKIDEFVDNVDRFSNYTNWIYENQFSWRTEEETRLKTGTNKRFDEVKSFFNNSHQVFDEEHIKNIIKWWDFIKNDDHYNQELVWPKGDVLTFYDRLEMLYVEKRFYKDIEEGKLPLDAPHPYGKDLEFRPRKVSE